MKLKLGVKRLFWNTVTRTRWWFFRSIGKVFTSIPLRFCISKMAFVFFTSLKEDRNLEIAWMSTWKRGHYKANKALYDKYSYTR